jgi:indolepyruvate ferredoxin oxidoreductase
MQCLAGGLNIRWPDVPLDQEARLHNHQDRRGQGVPFARQSARQDCRRRAAARLGIMTCGKSYMDVRQALHISASTKPRRNASGCASTR